MIDPKLINSKDAKAALGRLFDALPKGKKGMGMPLFTDMVCVEATMNAAFTRLAQLRQYFLDTTGPDSPFVKRIDELVPRS